MALYFTRSSGGTKLSTASISVDLPAEELDWTTTASGSWSLREVAARNAAVALLRSPTRPAVCRSSRVRSSSFGSRSSASASSCSLALIS